MVYLSNRAYLQMTAEIAVFDDLETGGLLLGRRDGGDIMIAEAVCGGPHAVRERCSFEYDPAYAVYEIGLLTRMYNEQKLEVLGVWHKHNHACTPPFSEADRGMHAQALRQLETSEIISLLFQKAGDEQYLLAAYLITTHGEAEIELEFSPSGKL